MTLTETQIVLKHTARAGEAIAAAYKGKIRAEAAKLLIIEHVRNAVKEAKAATAVET